jgi:hypothetical protein
VLLAKRLLERVQPPSAREPFDRLDLGAVSLNGEQKAGANRDAVEADRAGAAHSMLAADMRSGQADRVAQEIGEKEPRLDVLAVEPAVHGDDDRSQSRAPSVAVRQARATTRSTRSPTRWRTYAAEACTPSLGSISVCAASPTSRATSLVTASPTRSVEAWQRSGLSDGPATATRALETRPALISNVQAASARA